MYFKQINDYSHILVTTRWTTIFLLQGLPFLLTHIDILAPIELKGKIHTTSWDKSQKDLKKKHYQKCFPKFPRKWLYLQEKGWFYNEHEKPKVFL